LEEERRGVAYNGRTWLLRWMSDVELGNANLKWSIEPAKLCGKKRGTWFWRIRSIDDLDTNSMCRRKIWQNELMLIILTLPKELAHIIMDYYGHLLDVDRETSALIASSILKIDKDREISNLSDSGTARGVLKLRYPDCVDNLLYFQRKGPSEAVHLPEFKDINKWHWSTWHKHCDLAVCTEVVLDWIIAVFRVKSSTELYGCLMDQPPFTPVASKNGRWVPALPEPPSPQLFISRSLETVIKQLPVCEQTHCRNKLRPYLSVMIKNYLE
jgi:hypothetical protein